MQTNRSRTIRNSIATSVLALGALALGCVVLDGVVASPAGATLDAPTSSNWCSAHGSSFQGWVGLDPDVPICGPGPAYGGTWSYVGLPGPYGLSTETYYNATPGMQCVELAERFLAVSDGLAPVHANGAQVAMNYHAAYPQTKLYLNGTRTAIGHAPVAGDVISFSYSPDFYAGDGHVAVVVRSRVDARTGDGSVLIAQENVASADYLHELLLSDWRLSDPPFGGTDLGFGYAEWLDASVMHSSSAQPLSSLAIRQDNAPRLTAVVLGGPAARVSLGFGAGSVTAHARAAQSSAGRVLPGALSLSAFHRSAVPIGKPNGGLLAGMLAVFAIAGIGLLRLSSARRRPLRR